MKKFLLGLIGFVLAWGGGILAAILFLFAFGGEGDMGAGVLIMAVISLVVAFIGSALRRKAKVTCWCGGKGYETDSEYVGKDVSYNDTESGYKKNITKKYVVLMQCSKCGKQWTIKTTRTTTERHHFN